MSKTLEEDLRGVMETLLITLYIRAMESPRPDALIRDEKAEQGEKSFYLHVKGDGHVRDILYETERCA